MKDLLAWLDGKRTYTMCALVFACYALKKHGVEIPDEITAALVMATVMLLRFNIGKAECRCEVKKSELDTKTSDQPSPPAASASAPAKAG